MVTDNVNTNKHRGRETNNKRSFKSKTAGKDDEFIPKHSKKPKIFTGENGMNYLTIEKIKGPYQPFNEGTEDEIITVLDIYKAETVKLLANLVTKENTMRTK